MNSAEKQTVLRSPIIWVLRGFTAIASATQKLNIVGGIRSAFRQRHDVVHLESRGNGFATCGALVALPALQKQQVVWRIVSAACAEAWVSAVSISQSLFRIIRSPFAQIGGPLTAGSRSSVASLNSFRLGVFKKPFGALLLEIRGILLPVFLVLLASLLLVRGSIVGALKTEPLLIFCIPNVVPVSVSFWIRVSVLSFSSFVVCLFAGLSDSLATFLNVGFSIAGLYRLKSFWVSFTPSIVSFLGFSFLLFRSHKYMISNDLILEAD